MISWDVEGLLNLNLGFFLISFFEGVVTWSVMIVGLDLMILGEARILEVVPKSEPRDKGGYWGYTVRHASSLSTAISESTFPVCLLFEGFCNLRAPLRLCAM